MRPKCSQLVSLVLGMALLAPGLALADLQKVILDPTATESLPEFRVQYDADGNLAVRLHLPALTSEEIEVEGVVYQALTIPGGGIDGQEGRPGLPTISRLLAVPQGATVSVRVHDRREDILPGYRVFPVQPAGAEKFVVDTAFYAKSGGEEPPVVQIGEPAWMRHVQVVPVTFHPVHYDPAHQELRVVSSLDVVFEFDGQAPQPAKTLVPAYIPESFHDIYAEEVLGYVDTNSEVGPGSYLIICPDNASVIATLDPLLQWRRQQGYSVVLATLSETGSSNTAIKSYILDAYNNWNIPLEYVTLVGDANGSIDVPTWFENLSYYHGEGDHYYTTLVGNDVLSDVHLGRLSCRTITELQTIVAKIVGYETDPPLDGPEWFTRASLTGDPGSSGITTIYVNQWLKNQLLAIGYTQVDTIWSGNFVTQMMADLNAGCTVFGYRGYIGMSGMTGSHISSANNGGKLPVAIIPTCGTGSFANDTSCRSERFLRAPNGGGVASVGTATSGTHTRYNNCYYNGIWDGLVNTASHRVGVGHTLGKLSLYNNYQLSEPSTVEIWSMWNSLIGDPVTPMWTAIPRSLEVSHPALLPLGINAVPVSVAVAGSPLADARVSIFKADEILVSGYTDAFGQVTLPVTAVTEGELRVTVTRHNHLPYRGSLNLGSVTLFATLAEMIINDLDSDQTSGNGDGVANPGETFELTVALQNLGSGTAQDVTATLTSEDPYVNIVLGSDNFGDIGPGETVWGQSPFLLELDLATPDGHAPVLELVATNGSGSWSSLVPLTVLSAAFDLESISWSGPGSGLDPGETGNLSLQVRNTGRLLAADVTAHLTTESPWIIITDPDASFGNVAAGGTADHAQDPLTLDVSQSCFAGHLASFTLTLQFNGQALDEVEFTLPVGSAGSDDPVGPDGYGYYAFDNTDIGYIFTPTYNWVEIDPNYGGNGTSVGLTDFGWEQDDTEVVDLPFTFRFYGQEYDKVSICSNGWIVMGETYLRHYRNWSLPSAGSPDALIAPFWDNLNQVGSNMVYTWYDSEVHRFVIQWSRMPNHRTGAVQNFEVILYDPLHSPTLTGDGKILFQYDTVNNTDDRDGYATVGIQNLDHTDGLLYSYWNQYAPGAASLVSGRAILFQPVLSSQAAAIDVEPASISRILAQGETATDWLHISNNGEPGSSLIYFIDTVDPNYPTATVGSPVLDISGSTLEADPQQYMPGSTFDVVLTVTCVSIGGEWIVGLNFDLPVGVVLNSATPLVGGWGGPIPYTGPTGDGVTGVWSDGGFLVNGEQATSTVNLTFAEAAGNVTVPWELVGSNSGNPPHQITGSVVFNQTGPSVWVVSPNGGEAWAIGEEHQIEIQAQFGPELVTIALQREPGGPWETLATDVPTLDGGLTWTVTGPITASARVMVTDQEDPSLTDTSDEVFTIFRPLDWIQLDNYQGIVEQGSTANIQVTLDATGLTDDDYTAHLVVISSAGDPVVVPVTLTVFSGATDVPEDLPTVLALEGNFPNPFNPRTAISFALPREGQVRLNVYNVEGRRIATLLDEPLTAGRHHVIWDGRDASGQTVASGVYFYRLETGAETLSGKMVLMK